MKRLSVFGCLAISVLACDVAMADGNQIINLAAVTDVMSKNAPAKMDRQQFVDFLSGSSVTVNDVMVACIKSIPSDVACDECSKFVKEIIAEHNKAVDVSLVAQQQQKAVDVASSITAQPVPPKTSVDKDVVNKSSSQQNLGQSGGSASGAKTQQNKSSVTPPSPVPSVASGLSGYQSPTDRLMGGSYKY